MIRASWRAESFYRGEVLKGQMDLFHAACGALRVHSWSYPRILPSKLLCTHDVMLFQLGHGRHPQFRFFLNQECHTVSQNSPCKFRPIVPVRNVYLSKSQSFSSNFQAFINKKQQNNSKYTLIDYTHCASRKPKP